MQFPGKSMVDGRTLASEKIPDFFNAVWEFLGNTGVEGMLRINLHHRSVTLLPAN